MTHRITLALCCALLFSACKEIPPAASANTQSEAPLLTSEEVRNIDVVNFSRDDKGVHGGTSPAKVILKPNPSQEVRVAVYEEFSGGAGNQWRASVWMASFLAASTLGRQLNDYEFGVSAGGLIDGPSAGGLTTAAMMAAMTGLPVNPDVTMTGTVNPDGSIGPVGGIPQKIAGAAAKGKKVFGYPVGQRYDLDVATKTLVDLHGVASDNGVVAREVKDIYEAYELMTGKALPRPTPVDAAQMEISPKHFQRLQATASAWLARAESNIALLKQQRSPYAGASRALLQEAEASYERAKRYQTQGMVSVAYEKAVEAAAYTEVAQRCTKLITQLVSLDVDGVMLELSALLSVEAEHAAFLARLATEEPKSVAATLLLIDDYSTAVKVGALIAQSKESIAELMQMLTLLKTGKVPKAQLESFSEVLGMKFLMPTLGLSIAKMMLENSVELLSAENAGGPPFSLKPEAMARLARAYTSAAKANLDYYDALVLETEARRQGKSLAAAQAKKASESFGYLLTMRKLEFAIAHREDKGVPAALANLAAAMSAYLDSAAMVAEEYSLGVQKVGGEPKSLERDKAFMSMLELAELKARETASAAKAATGSIPPAVQVAYQIGRAFREGDLNDKLQALQYFWLASGFSQLGTLLARDNQTPMAAAHP